MGLVFNNIRSAKSFTKERLSVLQNRLGGLGRDGICVVVNGSYARLEAHPASDFDYFILIDKEERRQTAVGHQREVRAIMEKVVGRFPSETGAFQKIETAGSFGRTIGGNDDSNESITRRILFLIEGRPLCGSHIFDGEKMALLERYVSEHLAEHQLGRFLLNDIIRYYRTICVDFEHKTAYQGKPWGIRNIKLVFSRKMLYFGGVLAVAEMYKRARDEKIKIASKLMSISSIERIETLCGKSAEGALTEYDFFLGEMRKPGVRASLEMVPACRDQHTELFKQLKNRGHEFTEQLIYALRSTYPEVHPIHRALLM